MSDRGNGAPERDNEPDSGPDRDRRDRFGQPDRHRRDLDGVPDDERITARLVAVAVLGLLLFAPPLLSLFDRTTRVAGVPLLYAYLFAAWAAVIGLVAVVVRRTD